MFTSRFTLIAIGITAISCGPLMEGDYDPIPQEFPLDGVKLISEDIRSNNDQRTFDSNAYDLNSQQRLLVRFENIQQHIDTMKLPEPQNPDGPKPEKEQTLDECSATNDGTPPACDANSEDGDAGGDDKPEPRTDQVFLKITVTEELPDWEPPVNEQGDVEENGDSNGGGNSLFAFATDVDQDPHMPKDLLVCPIVSQWMMLATWTHASPFERWESAGADFDWQNCVEPESRKKSTLAFNITEWAVAYPKHRRLNNGLIVVSRASHSIYGDSHPAHAPKIFFHTRGGPINETYSWDRIQLND